MGLFFLFLPFNIEHCYCCCLRSVHRSAIVVGRVTALSVCLPAGQSTVLIDQQLIFIWLLIINHYYCIGLMNEYFCSSSHLFSLDCVLCFTLLLLLLLLLWSLIVCRLDIIEWLHLLLIIYGSNHFTFYCSLMDNLPIAFLDGPLYTSPSSSPSSPSLNVIVISQ